MEHGTYYNPEFRSPAGIEPTTGYVSDLITDKAIAWLGNAGVGMRDWFVSI